MTAEEMIQFKKNAQHELILNAREIDLELFAALVVYIAGAETHEEARAKLFDKASDKGSALYASALAEYFEGEDKLAAMNTQKLKSLAASQLACGL
jgi:hypothetical protein